MVSIKIRWHNIRIVTGIAMMSLILLSGSAGTAFSSTASYRTYAPGDLILSHEDKLYLWEKDVPMVSRGCGENKTLLKEGYLFLYDNVTDIIINNSVYRSAYFSLYKNGEIVTKLNVKQGDFFYYNKTIDGNEYTIIKFKVVNIFSADGLCGGYLAQIQPFFQYSDGTGRQEIQIGNSGLSGTEKTSGFEVFLAITIFLAVYATGCKKR